MTFMNANKNNAFTLIELLITISIIVLLVSILTVALTSARTAAQVAETQSRLTSLKQATVRFKEDVGYYPAVLDTNRTLSNFPVFPGPTTGAPQQTYRGQVQNWYSITSPAEYLIGYGNRAQDGYGRLPNSQPSDSDFLEQPQLGIRHPGMDGVWRATDSMSGNGGAWGINDRNPFDRGTLYGPYLEVENEQMFGRLSYESGSTIPLTDPVTGQLKIFYPGDPEYNPNNAMVIVDTWGTPIRYYRTLYPLPFDLTKPQMSIAKTYPPSNAYARPTMSDYFVLRPSEFEEGKVIDASLPDYMNGVSEDTGDTSTTMELQTGQFAYFSAGPDQQSNSAIRLDASGLPDNDGLNGTDESNADNIIEVGP
jgi:prepilin-type N-terminal cleavage/methylation domain-containing protein